MSVNIRNVKVLNSSQEEVSLSKFAGKVLLIVNVASKCGFTKQYDGLQKLQDIYQSKGFEILGFPCNDFGNQEPGSLQEIKEFCSSKFNVSFTIFEKVHAKGKTTEPFTTLNKSDPAGDVEWNFEKFLIDKEGNVLTRFKSSIEPLDQTIKNEIEKALST